MRGILKLAFKLLVTDKTKFAALVGGTPPPPNSRGLIQCPPNTMGNDVSLGGGGDWSDASMGFWDAFIAGDVATFGPSGQYGFSQDNWNSPMYGSVGNYTLAPWTIFGDVYTNETGSTLGVEGATDASDLQPQGQGSGPTSGPPSGGNSQLDCQNANIAAVNKVAPKLNLNTSNVTNSFFRNGAWNYDFSLSSATTNDLAAGRYPSSLINAVTGIGKSLHVPGPGGADPSVYGTDTNGNFTFPTHIDSAYATWHTPIGALIHWFVDVRDKGAHRGPC